MPARANTVPSPLSGAGPGGGNARLWALVPCAGNGSRAGADGPKQYHLLAGQPMVQHTLAAFQAISELAGILVVVSPGDYFLHLASFDKNHILIADCGGSTRAQSVFNGLAALQQQGAAAGDWVLVHDAARCLIAPAQIRRLVEACLQGASAEVSDGGHDGGLLALPLPDTLKGQGEGSAPSRVAATLPRAGKWLAQTPQMFRIGPLMQALQQAQARGYEVTDESSAMESAGANPLLVPGSAQNFKVTYPEDFALAEAVLRARGTG